ncbi:MAG: 2-hydroxyacid dehydrogenase, partial [Lactococcus lactis]|nr:2-hydroxyacid dehydrogenase [Lactococcus lactis]
MVIGDALVPADNLEKAALSLNIEQPVELVKYNWFPNLGKEAFQEKIKIIEQEGPEGMEIPDGVLDDLADTDYLLVHIAPISGKMIAAAPQLKLIGTCRGGLEHIALDEVKKRNIPLIHVIRNAEPVADYTLGLIFSLTRNIAFSHVQVMQGKWPKRFANDPYKTTISNLTVGLVGLGYIGKLVAKRLNSLGVKVLAYDPFIDKEKLKLESIEVEFLGLEDLFRQADVVSLHVRVTPETKEMVNEHLLKLMKPSSYLINTARPDILQKDAFTRVLEDHNIAGAAIDVVWEEPIPIDDPLLKLNNIIITSHIAGDTVDAIPR